MRFDDVVVESVVTVLPPNRVTSDEVEERLGRLYDRLRLPRGRLELMSGIHERRFWDPGTLPSQAAAMAGEKALAATGIEREAIGCLIHAAVCRDFMEPATASVIHERLNLSEACMIYDLSNACLGMVNGMAMIGGMIQLGHIKAGLVVSGETAEGLYEATIHEVLNSNNLSRADFKRHFASLTIGSGAAAVLLVHKSLAANRHLLLGGAVRTDSRANTLCRGNVQHGNAGAGGGPLMQTDSEALLHAGCNLAGRTWDMAKQELGWENDTPEHFFTHQVGTAHRNLVFETLEIDKNRDFPTVAFTGNTGSAALPTALALGLEEKRVAAGDRIALLGIGSGLSSVILGLEW